MFKPQTRTRKVIEYNGAPVAVEIYMERRDSVRYASGSKGFILRMPNQLSLLDQAKYWHEFVNWVYTQMQSEPRLRQRFVGRSYEDGSMLEVFGRRYQLVIREIERSSHHARLQQGRLVVDLVATDSDLGKRKALKQLISRCVGHDCIAEFSRRVHELNHLYFRREVRSINFKYNQTNWGSCSSGNNLNFSTRLLFAPTETIDYVIIHELAHLIELNHSDRFWALVEAAMPDYTRHEKWLKEHGHLCDF